MVVALAAGLAPLVDELMDNEKWAATDTSSALLVALVSVLVTARIASLRDDEGKWSFALAARRLGQYAKDIGPEASLLWRGPPSQLAKRWGRLLFGLGALLLGSATLLEIVTEHAAIFELRLFGAAAMGIAAGLLWSARRRAAPTEAQPPPVLPARLPAVLDCAEEIHLTQIGEVSEDAVLREVLDAIRVWRPRRYDAEDSYQADLKRYLSRRLSNRETKREVWVRNKEDGVGSRIDLVVNDHVAIEMKVDLDVSKRQKAVGQVRQYARVWRGKGPIILLVCRTDPRDARRLLESEFYELRQTIPVIAVVALA